ncbi:MAG: ATP-binding protein [Campylobacterota bacterium]
MFILNTIQRKIFVFLISSFLIFLSFHVVYESEEIKSHSFTTLDKMNTTINTIIAEYTSAYIYNRDIVNIQKTVDAIESDYVKSVYILDKDANIIVESGKALPGKIRHHRFNALLEGDERAIKNSDEYLILNVFDILDIPIGYMILEADLKTYHLHLDEKIKQVFLKALVLLVIFVMLSVFIAKSVSRPIQDIIDRLKVTKDNEVLKFPSQTQKEFQYLCENIAKTHNRLRTSNEDLEAKVDEKTYELQNINELLETRIMEEVEKNRLQNEQMLQQSRLAQMGEMISMIAHQWRQPLGAISTTAVNLQMKIELEEFDLRTKEGMEEYNNYFLKRLENINEFVNSLTTTIDDFRNFYRPNKKSVEAKLDEVILKSLAIIKASLLSDNIEVVEHYNSSEKLEMYDSEMMQVVLNILKNAQDNFREKASKDSESSVKHPQIVITTDENTISICDNGGGIPEDIIDKIFDPYFSTKDEKNGTGLGLYMSKTIVDDHHNGRLSVANRDDGVCFEIKLEKLNEKS